MCFVRHDTVRCPANLEWQEFSHPCQELSHPGGSSQRHWGKSISFVSMVGHHEKSWIVADVGSISAASTESTFSTSGQ